MYQAISLCKCIKSVECVLSKYRYTGLVMNYWFEGRWKRKMVHKGVTSNIFGDVHDNFDPFLVEY